MRNLLMCKCKRLNFLIVFDKFDHVLKYSFKLFVLSFHVLYFLFNEILMFFYFRDRMSVSKVDYLPTLLK